MTKNFVIAALFSAAFLNSDAESWKQTHVVTKDGKYLGVDTSGLVTGFWTSDPTTGTPLPANYINAMAFLFNAKNEAGHSINLNGQDLSKYFPNDISPVTDLHNNKVYKSQIGHLTGFGDLSFETVIDPNTAASNASYTTIKFTAKGGGKVTVNALGIGMNAKLDQAIVPGSSTAVPSNCLSKTSGAVAAQKENPLVIKVSSTANPTVGGLAWHALSPYDQDTTKYAAFAGWNLDATKYNDYTAASYSNTPASASQTTGDTSQYIMATGWDGKSFELAEGESVVFPIMFAYSATGGKAGGGAPTDAELLALDVALNALATNYAVHPIITPNAPTGSFSANSWQEKLDMMTNMTSQHMDQYVERIAYMTLAGMVSKTTAQKLISSHADALEKQAANDLRLGAKGKTTGYLGWIQGAVAGGSSITDPKAAIQALFEGYIYEEPTKLSTTGQKLQAQIHSRIHTASTAWADQVKTNFREKYKAAKKLEAENN
ncbi:hypothetical protein HYD_0020 [Candidatus Hydrogenosomobacter endosymbioticus]|uniref:Uncharacterized protein n=2 Tax=Candidatus Hydrogenosomobacter endosymbioticus TaxID=2558174 RepID=A0ABM7V7Z1_9PROT|nr:hypothetical protein HYD_0020 [Candidatus Hydrogenosomobacter endosymbioticus]